jgi:hypothetical protein
MAETKPEPKAGEPCPQCGDDFVEHRAPTDAERRAAEDREQARPYPARVDSAPAGVRETLGPLLECRGCGYRDPPTARPGRRAGEGPTHQARRGAGARGLE